MGLRDSVAAGVVAGGLALLALGGCKQAPYGFERLTSKERAAQETLLHTGPRDLATQCLLSPASNRAQLIAVYVIANGKSDTYTHKYHDESGNLHLRSTVNYDLPLPIDGSEIGLSVGFEYESESLTLGGAALPALRMATLATHVPSSRNAGLEELLGRNFSDYPYGFYDKTGWLFQNNAPFGKINVNDINVDGILDRVYLPNAPDTGSLQTVLPSPSDSDSIRVAFVDASLVAAYQVFINALYDYLYEPQSLLVGERAPLRGGFTIDYSTQPLPYIARRDELILALSEATLRIKSRTTPVRRDFAEFKNQVSEIIKEAEAAQHAMTAQQE